MPESEGGGATMQTCLQINSWAGDEDEKSAVCVLTLEKSLIQQLKSI
jgi:hypothetical protein